jgi:hypothetical protein
MNYNFNEQDLERLSELNPPPLRSLSALAMSRYGDTVIDYTQINIIAMYLLANSDNLVKRNELDSLVEELGIEV